MHPKLFHTSLVGAAVGMMLLIGPASAGTEAAHSGYQATHYGFKHPPVWPHRADNRHSEAQPRARLGIGAAALSGDELEQAGIEYGVRVVGVEPGSAAAGAGIEPGDIVTQVGERPAYSPQRLQRLVREAPERADIALLRDGAKLRVQADIGAAAAPGKAFLGVRIQRMTPELKQAFGTGNLGVLVTQTVAEGTAASAGIAAGDVIVRIGDKPVSQPADVLTVLDGYDARQQVDVAILRDRAPLTVQAELGARPRMALAHAHPVIRHPVLGHPLFGHPHGQHGYRIQGHADGHPSLRSKRGHGTYGHGSGHAKSKGCPMMQRKATQRLRYS